MPPAFGAKSQRYLPVRPLLNPELIQISTKWRPAAERPERELLPTEYKRVQSSSEGETAEPVCPHVTPAIVTHGDGIGKRLHICADQDCPVHHPSRTHTPDPDFEERQRQAEREREERKVQKAKREKSLRSLILRFPSSATEAQIRFLLKALVTGDLDDSLERIAA